MSAAVTPLYEIADEYQAVVNALEESGGVWTPEIQAQMDAIDEAFEVKVERTALFIQNLRADFTATRNESMRLSDRAAKTDRSIDALMGYLKTHMERVGKVKVETPLVTVRVQQNPPAVQSVLEGDAIPEAFRKVVTTTSLNKAGVLAAFKAGETLPEGITVTRGTSLRIA